MKTSLLTFVLLGLFLSATAQPKPKVLKNVIKLEMPDGDGHNGASVAWHPVLKRYYAAMAGNESYPLAVFDAGGKRLSDDELMTEFDVRGLWYNPAKKTIQMNGYDNKGWAEYHLNARGIPDDIKSLFSGQQQPDPQSVGAFNPARQVIYFLDDEGNLAVYQLSDATMTTTIELALGRTKKDDAETDAALGGNDDVLDDYNHAVVFTGIPGAEIALRNITENRIEFYNLKDGHLVKTLGLPDDAPQEQALNFAYCNNTWWLFDTEQRAWIGYR